MALPTFDESALGQTQEWLAESSAGLANLGLADPIQNAIEEAVQVVADHTALYELPRLRWERLMRPLALEIIYRGLGGIPDAIKDGANTARAELIAIRDGRFSDLPQASDPVQTIEPRAGNWGSDRKVDLCG